MSAGEHIPGIAILASRIGSTAESFIHATQTGILSAEVGLVVANNSNAGIFTRVDRLNKQYGLDIETLHISGATHPEGAGENGEQTLAEAEAIYGAIADGGFSLVALMGYMKKVRGDIPKVNTHPGPLPQTRGLFGIHVQEWVLANELGYSAQTFHVVEEGYDTGRILAEQRVPVLPGDTPDSLFESVQLTEKTHLPADIGRLLTSPEFINGNS